MLLIQLFVNVGSLLLLYVWCDRVFGRRVALVAASLYAIEPHAILYSVTLYSDTLFAFVFLAGVVALERGLRKPSAPLLVTSGGLLAIATLIRPVAQYGAVLAGLLIVLYPKNRWSLRRRAVVGFAVVFFLVLTPWLHRNNAAYDHVGLSTIGGSNLLFWNATYAEVARTGTPVEEVRAAFREEAELQGVSEDGNPFENSRIYSRIAIDYIRTHPSYYAARHLKGIANMFLNIGTKRISSHLGLQSGTLEYRFFAAPGAVQMMLGFLKAKAPHEIIIALIVGLFLLLTYLSAVVGGVSMLRRKKYLYFAITAGVLVYFSALTGLIGLVRYKLPIMPFYLALSAQGLVVVSDLRTRRRSARLSARAAEVADA